MDSRLRRRSGLAASILVVSAVTLGTAPSCATLWPTVGSGAPPAAKEISGLTDPWLWSDGGLLSIDVHSEFNNGSPPE